MRPGSALSRRSTGGSDLNNSRVSAQSDDDAIAAQIHNLAEKIHGPNQLQLAAALGSLARTARSELRPAVVAALTVRGVQRLVHLLDDTEPKVRTRAASVLAAIAHGSLETQRWIMALDNGLDFGAVRMFAVTRAFRQSEENRKLLLVIKHYHRSREIPVMTEKLKREFLTFLRTVEEAEKAGRHGPPFWCYPPSPDGSLPDPAKQLIGFKRSAGGDDLSRSGSPSRSVRSFGFGDSPTRSEQSFHGRRGSELNLSDLQGSMRGRRSGSRPRGGDREAIFDFFSESGSLQRTTTTPLPLDAESASTVFQPVVKVDLDLRYTKYQDEIVGVKPRFKRRMSLPSHFKPNRFVSLVQSIKLRHGSEGHQDLFPYTGPWDAAKHYAHEATLELVITPSVRSPRLHYRFSEDGGDRGRHAHWDTMPNMGEQNTSPGRRRRKIRRPTSAKPALTQSQMDHEQSRLRKVFNMTVEKTSELYAFNIGPTLPLQLGPQASEYHFRSHAVRQRVLKARSQAVDVRPSLLDEYEAPDDWLRKGDKRNARRSMPLSITKRSGTRGSLEAPVAFERYETGVESMILPEPDSIANPYVSYHKPPSSPMMQLKRKNAVRKERSSATRRGASLVEQSSRDVMMSFQNLLITPDDKHLPFDEQDGLMLDLEGDAHRHPNVARVMASRRYKQEMVPAGTSGRRTPRSARSGSESGQEDNPEALQKRIAMSKPKPDREVFVFRPVSAPTGKFDMDRAREKRKLDEMQQEAARLAKLKAKTAAREAAAAAAAAEMPTRRRRRPTTPAT